MHAVSSLKILEKLETTIGQLYATFSELFNEDQEASIFFRRLAREERTHANIVKLQINIVKKNPGEFGEIDMDAPRINAIIAKIERLIENGVEFTLEKAFEVAYNLEKDAAEQHFRTALETANQGFETMIRNLGAADDKHAESLVAFGESRGFHQIME